MTAPTFRLSTFYFFYFGTLGAMVPYWGLYLDSLGFNAREIGELMACLMATRIVSPNIWGYLADRRGDRLGIVRWGTFLAAACFTGVLFGTSYLWLAAVMSCFSFFWHAALPQFEAITLNHLGTQIQRYSHIRLWGSVGFIVAVAGLGPVLDYTGLAPLPGILVILIGGIWLASLLAPRDNTPPSHAVTPPLRDVLKRSDVRALLVVCVLMQASHGPYYTFYSLYLQDHGYTRSVIGQLWALGVVAEIGIFLVLHRLSQRFTLRSLLWVSLVLASVRWLMIGWWADSLLILLLAQLLHAATFGVYHAVAIQLVHGFFHGPHQGRGHALYSSIGFGAGGALGSLYSGYLWTSVGATMTFMVAAALSAAAWMVAWRWLRHAA
mgnify:CR=1 FL=1